jgi:hypothetical protein
MHVGLHGCGGLWGPGLGSAVCSISDVARAQYLVSHPSPHPVPPPGGAPLLTSLSSPDKTCANAAPPVTTVGAAGTKGSGVGAVAPPGTALEALGVDDDSVLGAHVAVTGPNAEASPEDLLLHAACRLNAVRCLRVLLRSGGAPDAVNTAGLTVRHGPLAPPPLFKHTTNDAQLSGSYSARRPQLCTCGMRCS